MNELRQEFEALCESNRLDIYGEFANGAWWAYQEQHKKIVAYQEELHHGEYWIDTSTVDKPQQSIIDPNDDDKIKEIFMVNSNELHNNR